MFDNACHSLVALFLRKRVSGLLASLTHGAGGWGLGTRGRVANAQFSSPSFPRRRESILLDVDSRLRGNDGSEVKTGNASVGAASHAANPSPQPLVPSPGKKLCYLLSAIVLLATPTLTTAATLTDPTRPSWRSSSTTQNTPSTPRFVLASILIASDRKIAIINGQAVSVGDIVDGAAVLIIDPNAVTLRRNNQQLILTLLPAGIKSR